MTCTAISRHGVSHSCQVLENRMLENKGCCAVALRNCEGAYFNVPEKRFHHKIQVTFKKRNVFLSF